MTVTSPLFVLDDTFVRSLEGMYVPWAAERAPEPELLVLNEELAAELGLDVEGLGSPEGIGVLVGNIVPPGARPVAQAYAGHQFGGFSPRLGDGRALLLGELVDVEGNRRDLHLKGSGRTAFARGGDGKAAVGPMLREYVIGEAMHALGIPTSRALAVTATGADVVRETILPGAVLARVAASHLRVGSFEYAAGHSDPTLLRRLADYAIWRHHPQAAEAEHPYLALFQCVVDAQAELVARWMLVGFVHGVMNTDNMTISGETIDYGPCAFMDAFDLATVFSSIDHGGRYAYGNQPRIAQWNLARLGEAMLPLFDDDQEKAVARATEVLQSFGDRFSAAWRDGMRAKLSLHVERGGDDDLLNEWLGLLHEQRADFTSSFRSLSSWLRGEPVPTAFAGWADRWQQRLEHEVGDADTLASGLDLVNPVYIPRNHLVEEALAAGVAGDLQPLQRLVDVLRRPFEARPRLERYAAPAPDDFGPYVTFCGT